MHYLTKAILRPMMPGNPRVIRALNKTLLWSLPEHPVAALITWLGIVPRGTIQFMIPQWELLDPKFRIRRLTFRRSIDHAKSFFWIAVAIEVVRVCIVFITTPGTATTEVSTSAVTIVAMALCTMASVPVTYVKTRREVLQAHRRREKILDLFGRGQKMNKGPPLERPRVLQQLVAESMMYVIEEFDIGIGMSFNQEVGHAHKTPGGRPYFQALATLYNNEVAPVLTDHHQMLSMRIAA